MTTARLVFDGDCGFCTLMAGWLRRIDRRARLDIAPLQRSGVPESIGSTAQQCRAALQWRGTDGSRDSGAAATNAALTTALGTRLPQRLYRHTGGLQEHVYDWVSKHRDRLPKARPYCETNPDDCTDQI